MKLTIAKRLIIMILLSCLFMAIGIYVSIITYNKLIIDTELLLKDTKKSELMIKDAQLALQWYKITKEEKYIREFRNIIKLFSKETEKRREHAQETSNKEAIITIESSGQKLREIEEKLEKSKSYGKDIETIWVDIMYALPGLGDDVRNFASFEENRLAKNTWSVKTTITIIGVVITILVIFLSILISKSIVRGIQKLESFITVSTRDGDLIRRVEIKSKDEIGRLASSFNTLISSMASIVKAIQRNTEMVSVSSKKFSQLTGELAYSEKNITDTVQGIANGAGIQFRQIEKTSNVIELLLNSVSTVASKSQNAEEKSNIAGIVAKRGSDATKETIAKMQHINEIVNNVASVIKKLGERSEQIGRIVDVITKISEQTNLLALNTAVEASRAGEAASGFAVVADEVRKLAEESTKSANEITALIREIQTEIYKAVNVIESGTKFVSESQVVVHKTEKSLEEYLKAIDESMQLSHEISRITKEQVDACQQVRKAIAAIETVAEENRRGTEGAFLSIKEQYKLMETTVEFARELENVSYELMDTVKKFKV